MKVIYIHKYKSKKEAKPIPTEKKMTIREYIDCLKKASLDKRSS